MKHALPSAALVFLLVTPSAEATNGKLTEPPSRIADALPVPARAESRGSSRPQYAMTSRTEVLLDGRPCQFSQVPATATIVNMEVSEDGRSILKVHFRSKR